MIQKQISISGIKCINLTQVAGDLQIIGWDRDELVTKCDEDELSVSSHSDELDIACDGDLVLYLRADLAVNVLIVEGDTDVRAVSGPLRLRQLAGDAQLRNVGELQIDDMDGDLSVRNCAGSLKAYRVEGDASIKDIEGDLHIDVEGDLTVRGSTKNLWSHSAGDTALYLKPEAGSAISAEAEGDLLAQLPARVDAVLRVEADEAEDLRVDIPGVRPMENSRKREIKLGSCASSILLVAEGDLTVTSRDDGMLGGPSFGAFGGSKVPDDLDERINRVTEEVNRQAIEAEAMASGLSEMIQSKVERAMRKVEEKMNSADRRARHSGFNAGVKPGGVASAPQAKSTSEPVTEAERLAILKMLQEKKITIQQAEELLAALDGKAG